MAKPQPAFQSKNKVANMIAWTVVVIMGCYILYAFWTIKDTDTGYKRPKTETASERDANIMAAVLCEDRVKEQLKSPRSADFPLLKKAHFDGRTAILSSYVEATNSFGAVIRTEYVCTVEYMGGKSGKLESWRVKDLAIME